MQQLFAPKFRGKLHNWRKDISLGSQSPNLENLSLKSMSNKIHFVTFFEPGANLLQESSKSCCFKGSFAWPWVKSLCGARVNIKHPCTSRYTKHITLQRCHIQIKWIFNKPKKHRKPYQLPLNRTQIWSAINLREHFLSYLLYLGGGLKEENNMLSTHLTSFNEDGSTLLNKPEISSI